MLERLGIVAAAKRSFALVKKDFWRVLGIWVLAALVAAVIAGAVGVPFSFAGQLLASGSGSDGGAVAGLILIAIGGAVGQILTAPFSAGVVVLLYTDRRMRAGPSTWCCRPVRRPARASRPTPPTICG